MWRVSGPLPTDVRWPLSSHVSVVYKHAQVCSTDLSVLLHGEPEKNLSLYFGPQLPCFLVDFYTSCTGVNRNECSTYKGVTKFTVLP